MTDLSGVCHMLRFSSVCMCEKRVDIREHVKLTDHRLKILFTTNITWLNTYDRVKSRLIGLATRPCCRDPTKPHTKPSSYETPNIPQPAGHSLPKHHSSYHSPCSRQPHRHPSTFLRSSIAQSMVAMAPNHANHIYSPSALLRRGAATLTWTILGET
jgi:hypothetical protein